MDFSKEIWLVAWLVSCVVCLPSAAEEEPDDGRSLPDRYADELGPRKTLDELLEYADERGPEIRGAEAERELGEAERTGAAIFQPSNPELESEVGIEPGAGEVRKLEATLKQRLEIAGERGSRLEAARRREETLEARSDRAHWSVRRRVRRLYRLGQIDRERVELEREILSFTDRLSEIAGDRVDAGEEGRAALLVGRAERAGARQRLVEAWRGYVRTLGSLGATIGWEASEPPQPSGSLPEPRDIPPENELLERAIESDRKLRLLRARLEEVRAQEKVARREGWPNPMLGIGVERERIGTPNVSNKLRFLVGLPLPLWERNQGEVALAEARERIVRQRIENRKRVLHNRITERRQEAAAAHRQAVIFEEEALPAIEEQFELLQEGFELGEMDVLEVMDARDRLLEARRNHLDALAEYVRATNDLEGLLGAPLRGTGD